jgi:hypothetical protein
MSAYRIARAIYRGVDRLVLARLPVRWEWRARGLIVTIARRCYPNRIQARSAGELASSSATRHQGAALPAWAVDEVRELARIEPALQSLYDGSTAIEAYVIPWDSTYVGKRYAAARRQLDRGYGSFLLCDAGAELVDAQLDGLPRPRAILDSSPDAAAGPLAARLGARHVWLPAEHLDRNDHCAVLARLILQCAPQQVAYTTGGVSETCAQRHGLALRSVSTLHRLEDASVGAGPAHS